MPMVLRTPRRDYRVMLMQLARPRSSVSEHCFGESEPYTLGIEEEYMLLDPGTLDLVQRADAILDAGRGGEFEARTACELFQSVIEGQTPVCSTVGAAAVELERLRQYLQGIVAEQRLVLASAGTHPFARYEEQTVTDRERYRGIVACIQYPARRELIFGLHVHVGVPDAATAIRVLRLLRPRIAELIALSASSPFWRGSATGLRSTRHSIFATFPRSGVPPAFADYAEFDAYVSALERGGALDDYTHIWWDLRPHPRLGTVEIRAMDAVERVEDAVALAAYVQALVARAGEGPPPAPASALEDALVRENKWQAIRYGLDATVIDARGDTTPIRDCILQTLEQLASPATLLGGAEALTQVEQIVRTGAGADRQLDAFVETGNVRAVAQQIADETSLRGLRLAA
jgi:carboxylate-amine ligase